MRRGIRAQVLHGDGGGAPSGLLGAGGGGLVGCGQGWTLEVRRLRDLRGGFQVLTVLPLLGWETIG